MNKLNLGLWDHVEEAIEANLQTQSKNGRTVIPTGGGKTGVQAHTLRLKGLTEESFSIHLVLAPRIALANQLIKDYRSYIGQNYLAMAFHSGKDEPEYQKVRWEELSSTSIAVVEDQIKRAKLMKKHLVIFSTYHSAYKLINLNFGLVIADESQYCTSKEYFDTIVKLQAKYKGFFTATERHVETTNLSRGLNNETVFGPIVYQVSAKRLIDEGIIVPPRVHIMEAEKNAKHISSIVDETIKIAQQQHAITVKSYTEGEPVYDEDGLIIQSEKGDQGMPYSKILFAMNSTDDIKKIILNVDKIKKAMPDHKIFTILSNEKYGAMVDGKKTFLQNVGEQVWENKITRSIFFRQLRECENALIFHYDIITEGIDIDGITGVVINRNMNLAKLLQTIGRAVRKYKANPDLKPWAWVTVPVIDGDIENQRFVEETLRIIRSGGFPIDNIKFTSGPGAGINDPEEPEQYGTPDKGILQTKIKNVVHSIENNEFFKMLANTTFEERIELAKIRKNMVDIVAD